jgi:hypothetical protein
MAQTATGLAPAAPITPPPSADLASSARIDFCACLQLLADRARFITGADWAAIALREDKKFIYRAAVGESAPEIGTEADLALSSASRPQTPARSSRGSLVITITRNSQSQGFVQLVSSAREFDDDDLRSITRLADFAGIALDHLEAAEQSNHIIAFQYEELAPRIPVLWHAPESAAPPDAKPGHQPTHQAVPAKAPVRMCTACGFPVSPGRTICMDCEEHGAGASPSPLFASAKHESWIRAHGYTIATVLISVLAAAAVYWLR